MISTSWVFRGLIELPDNADVPPFHLQISYSMFFYELISPTLPLMVKLTRSYKPSGKILNCTPGVNADDMWN